jgi:hypothetical protein
MAQPVAEQQVLRLAASGKQTLFQTWKNPAYESSPARAEGEGAGTAAVTVLPNGEVDLAEVGR